MYCRSSPFIQTAITQVDLERSKWLGLIAWNNFTYDWTSLPRNKHYLSHYKLAWFLGRYWYNKTVHNIRKDQAGGIRPRNAKALPQD